MEKLTVAISFLLMFGVLVMAQPSERCLNNETLERSYNYTLNINSDSVNMSVVKQEDCRFGCDNVTNSCAPNPVQLNAYMGFGIMFLLMFIGIIYKMWRY